MKKDIYSLIGNEIRAKLLVCLSKKSKNVTEMIQICGLTQSAVSQHLKKLKDGGLVTTKKMGKEIVYTLATKKAATISKMLITLQKTIQKNIS